MRLKVCGITRRNDADLLGLLGIDYIGFIFHPASKRAIHPSVAASIPTPSLKRVGVFVEQEADEILSIMDQAHLDYAQLHGKQSIACAKALGSQRVIRVLWPERYATSTALQAAIDLYHESSAFYLLDGGSQGGGHGTSFDWSILAQLSFGRPWFLAGGIRSTMLKSLEVLPYALDLNSGVEEAPGKKSLAKLQAVLAELSALSLRPSLNG